MRESENTSLGYFIAEVGRTNWKCMVLKGPWKDSYAEDFQRHKLAGIRLSRSAGWDAEDLDFLSKLPDLRSVEIYNSDVKNISDLWQLDRLEMLSLLCNFSRANDFASFQNLKECSMTWRQTAKSIYQCSNLERLSIFGYREPSLEPIECLTKLSTLALTSRTLTSLSGIHHLKSLATLDAYSCTKLQSIDELKNCRETLLTIVLDSCKQFRSLNPLRVLEKLRHLSINNCGALDSILPLENCKDLSLLRFWGDTKLADGDLSFLTKLPNLKTLAFTPRRHYSHTPIELNRIIGSR